MSEILLCKDVLSVIHRYLDFDSCYQLLFIKQFYVYSYFEQWKINVLTGTKIRISGIISIKYALFSNNETVDKLMISCIKLNIFQGAHYLINRGITNRIRVKNMAILYAKKNQNYDIINLLTSK